MPGTLTLCTFLNTRPDGAEKPIWVLIDWIWKEKYLGLLSKVYLSISVQFAYHATNWKLLKLTHQQTGPQYRIEQMIWEVRSNDHAVTRLVFVFTADTTARRLLHGFDSYRASTHTTDTHKLAQRFGSGCDDHIASSGRRSNERCFVKVVLLYQSSDWRHSIGTHSDVLRRNSIFHNRVMPLKQVLYELDVVGNFFFIMSLTCLFMAMSWATIKFAWSRLALA